MRRLLLVPFLLAAPARADAEAATHNDAGVRHLLDGEAAEAVAAFENALLLAPDSRTVKRNLAAGLAELAERDRKSRKFDAAVRRLDRALELHPERLLYRVRRGRARFEAGRDVDRLHARDDFSYVLERDPGHLDALVNLGAVEYADRRLEEAVDLWSRALALKPSDADIRGRLDRARRELSVERSFEELSSRFFLIRHAPEVSRQRAEEVLRLCEEAYGELSQRFESYPEAVTVVTLYTPAQFRSATRVHGWVGGLSDGTIRLTLQPRTRLSTLRATVYHELAHHLIRNLAPRVPVWLHEGLAQQAERKSVESAAARLKRERGLALRELAAPVLYERDPRRVSRYYDLALVFTHHLHGRHGDRGIIDLIRAFAAGRSEEVAVREVFGRSRDELFEACLATLKG